MEMRCVYVCIKYFQIKNNFNTKIKYYNHEEHEEKHLENRMGEHTGSPLHNFNRYIGIVGADLCVCPSALCW